MLIAQLSDPHLRPRGVLYQGLVDSNAMLVAAIETLNRLSPAPDVVILSGDVVDTGTRDEYAFAQELLGQISQPLFAIPGNHDEREAFRASFGPRGYLPKAGPLHFVADDLGPVRMQNVFPRLSRTPGAIRFPGARIDQHRSEILDELKRPRGGEADGGEGGA